MCKLPRSNQNVKCFEMNFEYEDMVFILHFSRVLIIPYALCTFLLIKILWKIILNVVCIEYKLHAKYFGQLRWTGDLSKVYPAFRPMSAGIGSRITSQKLYLRFAPYPSQFFKKQINTLWREAQNDSQCCQTTLRFVLYWTTTRTTVPRFIFQQFIATYGAPRSLLETFLV